MKKLFTLITLIFIVSYTAFAQGESDEFINLSDNFNYRIGTPYKSKPYGKKLKNYFFGAYGDRFLSVKQVNNKLYIQFFDETKLNSAQESVYDDFEKGFHLEGLIQMKERFYLLYGAVDKKVERLYCREIDISTGALSNNKTELLSVDGKITTSEEVKGIRMEVFYGVITGISKKYDFHYSEDSTKLLVRYRHKPKFVRDDKNQDLIGCYVFDDSMNKLWGRDVEMPYTEDEMRNLGYTLNSEGQVKVLSNLCKNDTSGCVMSIFSIDGDNEKISECKIDMGGRVLVDLRLSINSNGNVFFVGPYADSSSERGCSDGLFWCEVHSDETIEYKFSPIASEITEQYREKNKKANKKGNPSNDKTTGMPFLEVEELIFDDKGNFLIFCEERFSRTFSNKDGDSKTVYFHKNILAAKVDKDGNIAWI